MTFRGEIQVHYRYFLLAAAAAFGAASPALATAVAPAAQAPKAAPQKQATRAQLLKQLDATFKVLDKNGDGALEKDELAAAQARGLQQQMTAVRAKLDTEFTKLDTNKNGQLTKAEFQVAVPQAPTAATDVSPQFVKIDKNNDGKVTVDEYRALSLARFEALDKDHKGSISAAGNKTITRADFSKQIDATFKMIDANGDGWFSKAELAAAELKMRQQRAAAMRTRLDGEFTKLDTNRDGQLSRTEFMVAAPSMPAKMPDGSSLVAELDKNHDGKISPDEYRVPMLARFDTVDSNHDGSLSPTERQAAQASRKQ
jgi:Ca2+-binding EF-hand superfamily protein